MLAGFVTFQFGRPWLEGKAEPPDPARLARRLVGPLNLEWLTYLGGIAGVAVIWALVQHNRIVGYSLGLGWVLAIAYIVWILATRFGRVERERVALSFVFMIGAVVFFTLFEQAATSLNLFAERNVQLGLVSSPHSFNLLGRQVFLGDRAMWQGAGAPAGALWIDMGFDAAQTQSFNAGFILLLAPAVAALWAFLGRRRWDLDPMVKFGLGLAQVGLGFLVIVWSAGLANSSFRVPLLVLAFAYLLHTTGELCLSPVGLSQMTKLAPAELASTLMSLWFMATSLAEFVAAAIAGVAGSATAGGKVLDPHASLTASIGVFEKIGWAGIACGGLFLLAAPFGRRWSHGANDLAPEPAPAE